MRFIQKWSYFCANYLYANLHENHSKRGVYYYGFQVVIGGIVKAVLVVIITLLTGSLLPAMIIIGVFGSIRVLAGGYHMDTYGRCIITSLAMFVLFSIVDQYTYKYWNNVGLLTLTAGAFLFSLVCSFMYAPKDNPNRPITSPEEIKKFKQLTIVYEVVLLLGTVILIMFGFKMAAMSISVGAALEIFTITPTGHKFFDLIKGGFKKYDRKKVTR
ncbi:MAG: accessory gene regulator B family protein [Bacteroidota bacterium]|nr:accessory gene regulator B family protein [Bacteroidota bacterium]